MFFDYLFDGSPYFSDVYFATFAHDLLRARYIFELKASFQDLEAPYPDRLYFLLGGTKLEKKVVHLCTVATLLSLRSNCFNALPKNVTYKRLFCDVCASVSALNNYVRLVLACVYGTAILNVVVVEACYSKE